MKTLNIYWLCKTSLAPLSIRHRVPVADALKDGFRSEIKQ